MVITSRKTNVSILRKNARKIKTKTAPAVAAKAIPFSFQITTWI